MSALSTLATFDDIRRCVQVLTDGTAEEEFLRALRLQENFRRECIGTAQEAQRIQKELDSSLQSMADLETKLFHARRLLEMESKARREAEYERDLMEKKIVAVADLLQHERNLKDETKDKLAFLNTLPRKRKSLKPHLEEMYGNDINSTGSFLSDLSITQSEDDLLDEHHSKNWQKHRPSVPKNDVPCVGNKRSRLSGHRNAATGTFSTPPQSTRRSATRRSGLGIQEHKIDFTPFSERICATTKVSIPQDGSGIIRAESTIETTPIKQNRVVQLNEEAEKNKDEPGSAYRLAFKDATAPPLTPAAKMSTVPQHVASPAQQLRSTMLRKHNFALKTFLRADTCMQCQKKIRFGSVGLRCRDCPIRCHQDCRYLLTTSCVPQSGTPTTKGPMGYISDYAPAVSPMIPALIVHCVNEIEARGLKEIGLYRVSGSDREIKSLAERFLRGKGTPHLGNIDIHVICGCIKDFLRSLREPLIPTNLWKDFANALQNPDEVNVNTELYKAIDNLPQANRDTLAFLILHLLRIAECPDVRMPIENISRIFGPTIVGYSVAQPDQHAIFTEVIIQCNVMSSLLKIPNEYWVQYLANDAVEKENRLVGGELITRTPSRNQKESLCSIYATPLKSTIKKRKFYATPPYQHKK